MGMQLLVLLYYRNHAWRGIAVSCSVIKITHRNLVCSVIELEIMHEELLGCLVVDYRNTLCIG